jgi:lysophospholipase L1-like esterase
MKRYLIILFILCVSALAASLPVVATVYAVDEPQKKMLSFGDSITSGYGLGVGENYAQIFADENGYILTNYAVSGYNSGNLLTLLNSGSYNDNIANADLITVCIGANDILSLVTVFQSALQSAITPAQINAVFDEIQSAQFTAQLQTAVDNFESNFTEITAHFTNAVYFTIYNPYSGVVIGNALTGVTPFNLGLFTEIWVEKINNIIRRQGKFFDMFRSFENYRGMDKHIVANFTQTPINADPHPTLLGQQFIAKQFENYLKQPQILNNSSKPNTSLRWWGIMLICFGGVFFVSGTAFLIIKKLRKTNIVA